MVKYDQGGGCACGLYRYCECSSQRQSDNTRPFQDQIFVFGSNEQGRHGKGAALTARSYYGAVQGKGEGLQGKSYAIPTKSSPYETLSLPYIKDYVNTFIEFAKKRSDLNFYVTAIGCGHAGYRPEDIAPFFEDIPHNVQLCSEFCMVLVRKGWTPKAKPVIVSYSLHGMFDNELPSEDYYKGVE